MKISKDRIVAVGGGGPTQFGLVDGMTASQGLADHTASAEELTTAAWVTEPETHGHILCGDATLVDIATA